MDNAHLRPDLKLRGSDTEKRMRQHSKESAENPLWSRPSATGLVYTLDLDNKTLRVCTKDGKIQREVPCYKKPSTIPQLYELVGDIEFEILMEKCSKSRGK